MVDFQRLPIHVFLKMTRHLTNRELINFEQSGLFELDKYGQSLRIRMAFDSVTQLTTAADIYDRDTIAMIENLMLHCQNLRSYKYIHRDGRVDITAECTNYGRKFAKKLAKLCPNLELFPFDHNRREQYDLIWLSLVLFLYIILLLLI